MNFTVKDYTMTSTIEGCDNFFYNSEDICDEYRLEDLEIIQFYDEIEKSLTNCRICSSLLDLGCGTGLELERIFHTFSVTSVTCVNISHSMLEKMLEQFPYYRHRINSICGSFFSVDLGIARYDCALSTYSLHYFNPFEKLVIYQRLHNSLKPGGIFIIGDYIAKTFQKEYSYRKERLRLKTENKMETSMNNFKTPLTIKTETGLLNRVGFTKIMVFRQWENRAIIIAEK